MYPNYEFDTYNYLQHCCYDSNYTFTGGRVAGFSNNKANPCLAEARLTLDWAELGKKSCNQE